MRTGMADDNKNNFFNFVVFEVGNVFDEANLIC